jgi:ABC-type lipoprotein export system ATPase subunit
MAATLWIEQLSAKAPRLSTGERQRAAIARAGSGAAVVADEPKGGLDREGIIPWRGILQQALRAIQRSCSLRINRHRPRGFH